jgi:hypothetical protein
MAASIVVEAESGTYVGHLHPHNGYYAGDFSSSRYAGPAPSGPGPRPVTGR